MSMEVKKPHKRTGMAFSKLNAEGYQRIGVPEHVINWIVKGVRLPFKKVPNRCSYKNRISGVKQMRFMDEQVTKLVSMNKP